MLLNAIWLHWFIFTSWQIDSLKSQHSYLEKQLDSLRDASQPKKDELDRLHELKSIISEEENEIDRLIQGSKQLKEKVGSIFVLFYFEVGAVVRKI